MFLLKGDMFSQLKIPTRSELWADEERLFLVTGNSTVKRDGGVVMGRGAALQLKNTIPKIDKAFGDLVKLMIPYHIIVVNTLYGSVGLFQVKHYYASKADLGLIKRSTNILLNLASSYDRIDLNFPGIGNGKLSRADVLPILESLPSNVFVWEYE